MKNSAYEDEIAAAIEDRTRSLEELRRVLIRIAHLLAYQIWLKTRRIRRLSIAKRQLSKKKQ